MGNDQNDITMFKSAIDGDGYIVLVEHEDKKITKNIIKELKEYVKEKGKQWEYINLIQIRPEDMNNFLSMIATRQNQNKRKNFLDGLRINIKREHLQSTERKTHIYNIFKER